MKVLFLHGTGDKPGGIRSQFLRQSGFEVIDPALPDYDFEQSVQVGQEAFDRDRPDVVVGSSRGGGVALRMDTADVPVVLVAPAWKGRGADKKPGGPVTILHSENDDIVPIEGSRELLRIWGEPEDRLKVVGLDHRMRDDEAFAALVEAINLCE